MAVEVHISRPDNEISLDEWKSAVAEISGLRLAAGDLIAPAMPGKTVTFENVGGDVEVDLGADGWTRVFYWRAGEISFRATEGFITGDADSDIVYQKACALAEALSAEIVDDDGEPCV